jgi:hypothetical protein
MLRVVPSVVLTLALCAGPVLARQDETSGPVGPSPPPNRFDPEHDARLAWAWRFFGSGELLNEQRPAIVPRTWIASLGGPASPRADVLERYVVRGERLDSDVATRLVLDGSTRLPSFAIAEAAVHAEADEVRFVRASGVHRIFVNGEGFVGDPERRGDLGVPVLLRAGENRLQLVGFDGGLLEVELWDPVSDPVVGSWAVELDAERQGGLRVPMFNATATAAEFHFHYGDHAQPVEGILTLAEWECGGSVPPLSMILETVTPEVDGPDRLFGVTAFRHESEPLGDRERPDRRLLRAPKAPIARSAPAATWPPSVEPPDLYVYPLSTYFVHERSDDPELERAAFAVARYAQQVLWYATGELPYLVSDARFGPDERAWPADANRVVRFGPADTEVPGTLLIDRESERAFSVRATDAEGLHLVYLVEPFLRAIETPATFRVP